MKTHHASLPDKSRITTTQAPAPAVPEKKVVKFAPLISRRTFDVDEEASWVGTTRSRNTSLSSPLETEGGGEVQPGMMVEEERKVWKRKMKALDKKWRAVTKKEEGATARYEDAKRELAQMQLLVKEYGTSRMETGGGGGGSIIPDVATGRRAKRYTMIQHDVQPFWMGMMEASDDNTDREALITSLRCKIAALHRCLAEFASTDTVLNLQRRLRYIAVTLSIPC